MKPVRHLLFASLALGAVAAVCAPGCDLVVDASSDSCESDADCVNRANTVCDSEQHVCVSLDTCQVNADCPSDQICRHFSPRACVSLKTPVPTQPADESSTEANCQIVYPDDPAVWRDDSTILIGVTAPRSYQDGEDLVPSIDSITNGAILAVDELNDKGGLNNQNKLALVICDDYGTDNFAENNGRALAAMGVQSIVGAAYSSQTIAMAAGTSGQPGTVANGQLTISSGATSPDVTGIEDHAPACVTTCGSDTTCADACPGLVWRTSPSDQIQGDAINAYFKDLEPIVKNRTGTEQAEIKVTILHRDDSYGKNLADFVAKGLEFNGKKANLQTDLFHVRNYGSAATPAQSVIDAAIADQPDVLMLLCTFDELAGVVPQIEAQWLGASETLPYYVLADGGLNDTMVGDLFSVGAQGRTRGVIPGTDNDLFKNFGAAYLMRFPDKSVDGTFDTFGAAGAYDSIYLMAYSAIAAKDAPLTGEQLASGLSLLSDVANGQVIEAGPLAFGQASNDLRNGQTLNFEGASGPLDFDLQTGEAPSDINVWCIDGTGATQSSGRHYDAKTGKMAGAVDSGACPF